jgi:hypothetical protein
MSKKLIATVGLVLGISTCLATAALAGIPFAPYSTCAVAITQNPTRTGCMTSYNPDVVRLCPSTATPIFDSVSFSMTILDALAAPVSGASVTLYETSGTLNIVNATTATTNASGKATVTVAQGGGNGRLGVCAGGVLICEVYVHSPDVNNGALAANCTAVQGTVNLSDITNTTCGFNAASKFGPVVFGSNDGWDLDCNLAVNASDINGNLVAGMGLQGGVNQHFGHSTPLGAKSTCP